MDKWRPLNRTTTAVKKLNMRNVVENGSVDRHIVQRTDLIMAFELAEYVESSEIQRKVVENKSELVQQHDLQVASTAPRRGAVISTIHPDAGVARNEMP